MKRNLINLARYGSFGLLTASFMVSCGQDDKQTSEVKVTNGLEVDNSDYPSVVLLLLNGRTVCTGTFVNDSQLITAAHCVYGMNGSRPDIRLVEPVHTADGVRYRSRVQAESVVWNRSYNPRKNRGVNGSDLAVVNFPRHSAPGVRRVADYSPELDQKITIVGFGSKQGSGSLGMQEGKQAGKKRVGTNFVQEKEDGMIVFRGLDEAVGGAQPGKWTTSGDGDSGGPLFIKGRLAGVTSGGGVYQDEAGETRSVSKYVDLNSDESSAFLTENLKSW